MDPDRPHLSKPMPAPRTQPRDPVVAVGLLDEPVRRRVYEWVVAAGRPVARDEVAAGVGIGRPLAAFHLDRLAEGGLLEVEYRRRTGRSGPGAGRPAKFYRRSAGEIRVSLPERRYELMAELFASAVEARAEIVPPEELVAAARAGGYEIGSAVRSERERTEVGGETTGAMPPAVRAGAALSGDRLGGEADLARLVEVLADVGYEPAPMDDGVLMLRNCPFDALVDRHRTLVCGTNLAFVEGLLAGLGVSDAVARLDPGPGRCCVVFARRSEDVPAR